MTEPALSGPYVKSLAKRKKQNRSAITTISATDGETGVGKTALFTMLANYFDTSETPFRAREKASYSVAKFIDFWHPSRGLPKGSACGLDEAEQLDARRANKHENVETGRAFETRRVAELTAFLILPSVAEIDPRIERLHNYWIDVKSRGRARVYSAHIHNQKQNIYYRFLQEIEWPSMDAYPEYQEMVQMKEEWSDDDGPSYVREDEIREEYEQELEERETDIRDRIISNAYQNGNLTQKDIAEMLPEDLAISRQRVGQIANGGNA